MPEIIPIKDLRDTNKISELCHSKKEPIFITKNGYGDLVIMSIETYRRKLAQADLYEKLAKAEREIENGEPLLDTEEVFAELRSKYVKK